MTFARARLSIIDYTLILAHHSRVDAELLCPACRIPLTEMRTGNGIIWRCEKCDGRAVGLQLLRRTFTPESINPLWLHAIHNEGRSARPCPSCGNAMFEVALDSSSGIRVEVCRICEFVWFDAGETQTLQARPLPKPPEPLPQRVRETIALAKVQQLAEQARGSDFDSASPDEWWKQIAAFFRNAGGI
jgi:Zn-finger nucleic acid-binding protein